MTGSAVAALTLSLALLVWPSPRLAASRGVPRWASRAALVGAAAGAVVTLPMTTLLTAAVLAATVGYRYRRSRRRRRGLQEAQALQAALDVLVGELRVGAHPVRAFATAAAETGRSEVASGLRAVAARARLGADVAGGLRGMAGSVALGTQWERLAVCWQLATEHGLSVSTLLRAAQRDLIERQQFSMRVWSALAGARATAVILTALPVLGVALGQLIGAHPVGFLLGAGGWFLAAGVGLACGGLLWCDRLTEGTPR